ncbi:nodulation protein [Sesbania bispinosa]|nr:nodulation protein [Sesbania bispinosa]
MDPLVDRCHEEPNCVGPFAGRVDLGSNCDALVLSTTLLENNPSTSLHRAELQKEMDARDCTGDAGTGQGGDYSLVDMELFEVPIVSVEGRQELDVVCGHLNRAQREVVPKK